VNFIFFISARYENKSERFSEIGVLFKIPTSIVFVTSQRAEGDSTMYQHSTVQGHFQGPSDDLHGWKYGCLFGKEVARDVYSSLLNALHVGWLNTACETRSHMRSRLYMSPPLRKVGMIRVQGLFAFCFQRLTLLAESVLVFIADINLLAPELFFFKF